MPKKIDMTGWIMKEHGVPDSLLTVIKEVEPHITIGVDSHNMQLIFIDDIITEIIEKEKA